MNNFWNLLGFEFKKIFHRKIFLISILICLAVIFVTLFAEIQGNSYYHKEGRDISQYEAMKMDKSIVISNQGDITPELLSKAILANKEMVGNLDNYIMNEYGKHLKGDAYIKYVLPYESIVNLLNTVYEKELDWLSMDNLSLLSVKPDKAIDSLTPEDIKFFDKDLKKFAKAMVTTKGELSPKIVKRNEEMINQIKIPLYNDYYKGYEAYIRNSKELAMIVLVLILILLAPIFSNEYEEQTQQLILSTKNGKNSLCKAKIAVALIVSLVSCVLIMGIGFFSFLSIFGFEGKDVNIQVINPSCTYSLTLFEACWIHFLSVIMASTLFALFITFISANVKKRTFPVVIIGMVVTLVPMFIWVPLKFSKLLYNMFKFFPINAVTFEFNTYFFEVFGLVFTPYKFICTVSAGLIIAFSYMAARSFNNHQVC